MNQRVAFPFSRLDAAAVGFAGWRIGDPGEPLVPATDIFEGWDYERDLEVGARFEIDFDRAAVQLGIPLDQLSMALVLKAGTGSGKMPRRMDRIQTRKLVPSVPEFEVRAVVTGSRLSGRLLLEAGIVLDAEPASPGALSPAMPGARLWTERKDILLEDGGAARFPLETISFASAFAGQPHASAPWYVHWRSGLLDADFGGAVRVYVNADMTELCERFVAGDPATVQAVLGDVMSQMIENVVGMPDCDEALSHCVEGSVGDQVRNWLDMAFPGQSLNKIRAELTGAPGRFRATIMAAAQVGEGE
ncbi:hypothetical protein [Sagittula sp. S175]|uniref:hypothetical protein n=1 Tax=Sagittula sp. S175 TaxID=3415129 RepID=UPI003C7D9F7B